MLSDTRLVLCFALMTVSFAGLGWAQIAQDNCYGSALISGQCSLIPGFVESGLGYAGSFAGFYLIVARFIRPSWKTLAKKRSVVLLGGLGIIGGIAVSEAIYYLARATGLIVADYPSCGGYSLPLGCYIYNPLVQFWFLATGGVAGAVAGIILPFRFQTRPRRLTSSSVQPSSTAN